jgi:hypothetical protein
LNLFVDILNPTRIVDGHLQYSGYLKVLVEVEAVGSTFKKVVLVNSESTHLGNSLSDPSQLILYAKVYCASCAAMQAPDAPRRCDPLAFFLPAKIESPITVLMSLDDFNTRPSQTATFNVPPRYQRPSDGQWFRCGRESLMYVSP